MNRFSLGLSVFLLVYGMCTASHAQTASMQAQEASQAADEASVKAAEAAAKANEAAAKADAAQAAAQAVTPAVVGQRVIVTEVPAAKEVIVAPTGYVKCDTIAAGWQGDVWIPAHQVCEYANSAQGVAWIEGYWACTKYRAAEGVCTAWDWRPGHWVSSRVTY